MMQKGHKQSFRSKMIGGAILALFLSLMSLLGSLTNYLAESPDEFVHDWRVSLFSNKVSSQRKDIALIYIDDETLASYPYKVPVNRALLASLVTSIDAAQPKGIGVDMIFDRSTEPADDEQLLAAFQNAKSPLVLVGTDQSESGVNAKALQWQSDFLRRANRIVASPFFSTENSPFKLGSDVIRRMGDIRGDGPKRDPFALALARLVGEPEYPSDQLIDWLLPAENGAEIFQTYAVPSVSRALLGDPVSGLIPEFFLRTLKGKIVIIAGAMSGLDWHRVPMTISDNQLVPGAWIHAQMLAQIIDGREIREVSPVTMMFVVFFTSLCLYLAIETFGERHPEIIFEFLIVSLAVVLGTVIFWKLKVSFPTSNLMLSWLGVAFLAKYTSQIVARWQERVTKKEGSINNA